MLTRSEFIRLKYQNTYTLSDVAMLICTVERLDERIGRQNEEIKRLKKASEDLKKRVELYRNSTLKVVK